MQEWRQEQILEMINSDSLFYLYMYTPLCGTCNIAGKMLTVVEELMPHIQLGKADLNYIPEMAEIWKVESVPCLIIFKKGNIDEKIYAFHSVPYLLDKIK